MRGEAVHRHRFRACRIHEGVVDPVGGEGVASSFGLGLPPIDVQASV